MTDQVKAAKILVADDQPSMLLLLQDALQRAGYQHVVGTADASGVVELFRELRPDLVILDVLMPGADGIRILEELHGLISPDDYLPIIIISGDLQPATRLQALMWGAKDVIAKPFDILELMLRIDILLETRMLLRRASGDA